MFLYGQNTQVVSCDYGVLLAISFFVLFFLILFCSFHEVGQASLLQIVNAILSYRCLYVVCFQLEIISSVQDLYNFVSKDSLPTSLEGTLEFSPAAALSFQRVGCFADRFARQSQTADSAPAAAAS